MDKIKNLFALIFSWLTFSHKNNSVVDEKIFEESLNDNDFEIIENNEPISEHKVQKKVTKPKISRSQIIQIGILLVLLVILGFLLFGRNYKNTEINSNILEDNTTKLEDKETSETETLDNLIMVNPFVDDTMLAKASKNADGGVKLPSASRRNNVVTRNGALPVIPGNLPRPNIPAFTLPNLPQNSALPAIPSTPAKSQSQASVQGVFTGDDGNNMAIMSDGSVVSAGESYQDGRIAYIGGDGIHFDDGSSIKYGDN